MNQQKIFSIIISILLAICAWLGTATYNKISGIEKDLVSIRIDLTRLQSQAITEQRVKQIASKIFFQNFHNK